MTVIVVVDTESCPVHCYDWDCTMVRSSPLDKDIPWPMSGEVRAVDQQSPLAKWLVGLT